jgi:iron(III) transport system substrate-binding protein
VALAGGGLLAACGGNSGPTLTVYSGRHYGIESAFEKFEDETGIDVEFLTGNDAELRERIAAEGDETEADVYLTVDAGNLWRAAEDDLFQPIHSAILDEAIPSELRDSEDRWFGLAVRTRTIVYNTNLVDLADVPTTYEELADPEYKGRLCLRNSSEDYQQSLVASMIAADGEETTREVLQGWAANADIYANDISLLEAMVGWRDEVRRACRPRAAVPGMAGDRRSEHVGGRQPRVPRQPGGRAGAVDPRDVRHRLRARPAARRRARLVPTPKPSS